MKATEIITSSKQLIGQGDIEQAIESLVAFLESDSKYAELAQVCRINQADLYQNKAQVLKGIISNDDARLVTNQVTDNVYQVLNRLEAGKTTLVDAEIANPNTEPTSEVKWKYYIVGGIGALTIAVLAYLFFFKKPEKSVSCPDFGKNVTFKALIIPLKQTGDEKTAAEPEVDIMVELNKLLEKSGSNAISNIKPNFTEGYPTPEQAAALAKECEAQMIVYGRNNGGVLDIEFKVYDEGGVYIKGDSSFNQLLVGQNQGKYTQSAVEVARYLFTIISNKVRQPIAAVDLPTIMGLIPSNSVLADPAVKSNGQEMNKLDTAMIFAIAENQVLSKDYKSALINYKSVLEVAPSNKTALKNVGILTYKTGDFETSSRNLEAAIPDASTASPEILKLRTEAHLKNGQVDKAEKDLEVIKEKSTEKDKVWIEATQKTLDSDKVALKEELKQAEKKSKQKPKDSKSSSGVAHINQRLGAYEEAIKYAKKVQKNQPQSVDAMTVLIDANMSKGDSVAVRNVIEQARKAGVLKEVVKEIPKVAPLLIETPKKDKQ
jgi:tetratricopeptide (TPR) repeat protein